MGWGMQLLGLGNILAAFDNLKLSVEGDTIYVTGTNVEYAVYQEFGTSAIAARPAMRKAVSTVKRNIGSIVSDASSEEEVVKLVALAIEREWKQNIRDMDIIDTGTYRDSVRAEKVK